MIWNAKNGTVCVKGAFIDFVRFGRGKKKLVVLPGLSEGLSSVRGKALLLAPTYRKYFGRYTVYMIGKRRTVPQGMTMKDIADDTAAAMRILGIRHADLLGVSQGGIISQYIAGGFPELVDKLVLVVTAPRTNAIIRGAVGRWIGIACKGDHKQLMIDTTEKTYSERYLKKARMMYPFLGLICRQKSFERFINCASPLLDFDASEYTSRIACPTLIIGGGTDRIVGVGASLELKNMIRGSRLCIYRSCGHAPYDECAGFYDRVLNYLSSESSRELAKVTV